MNNENEQKDGKAMDKDESLEVNHFCTRSNNKLHVLLELKPFQIPARNAFCQREHLPRIPLRLVCVIDVSHSMAEAHGTHSEMSKLDKIKMFGHLLVQSSGPEDHLGVVVFGTAAETVFPLQRMTEEAKTNLTSAVEEISLKGVTNMSAGIFLAIDQFNQTFGKKCRCSNDNIMLFSDGMPNEGIVNSHELTKEISKRVSHVAEENRFGQDYCIKFTTIGTSGFYPETLYHLGRLFGGGAFYHLGEDSDISSDLMLAVLSLQETVLTGIRMTATALNGVLFEPPPDLEKSSKSIAPTSSRFSSQFSPSAWEEYLLIRHPVSSRSHRAQSVSAGSSKSKIVMSRSAPTNVESSVGASSETHPTSPVNSEISAEPRQHYLFHDIGIDMEKHVLLTLQLPKKHKKILKGKDVLSIKISYTDHKMSARDIELIVSYRHLPPKEAQGTESDIITTYKTLCRIKACSAFDRAAGLVAKLDRSTAIHVLDRTIEEIRNECEKLLTDSSNEEETYSELYKTIDPLLANMNKFCTHIGDYSMRWDDVWGRLKSLRSSIGRETITSPSVYADRLQMFMTEELEAKIREVSNISLKLHNQLDVQKGSPAKTCSSPKKKPLPPVKKEKTKFEKSDRPSRKAPADNNEGSVTQV